MRVGVSFLREDKLGAYVQAVRAAGLEPVPISPAQMRGLEDIGGLVLTGGGDGDPSLYGAEAHAQTKHVCRERRPRRNRSHRSPDGAPGAAG